MHTQPGPGLLPDPLADRVQALVSAPASASTLFLSGPAGSGKTTAGVVHTLRLLAEGVPADSILVLAPQRTLARPYLDVLRSPLAPAGAQVDVLTIGGLAQRAVELYWPLIAGPAGFAHPEEPPLFLTLETAQYYMDRLIAPYVQRGAFGDVTLSRQRLISQVLDNLNKAAIARFPYTEIGERLSAAWSGESARRTVYREVQACAEEFRRFCLAHNLLDFSLQIELFSRYVLSLPQAALALRERYRHLVADNLEEDVPLTHDLLADWLPGLDSAWLLYDEDGGLRTYLGADPQSALALRERCAAHVRWGDSLVTPAPLNALASGLSRSLGLSAADPPGDPRPALVLLHENFQTETIKLVASEIVRLVAQEGVPAGEIAVLAPFMGDALRFALITALEREAAKQALPVGLASYSQRPSRALRDEPATRCLLTLARLAHPAWNLPPSRVDVAHALVAAIAEMDLVRAWHLTAIVYRTTGDGVALTSFERVRPEEQMRVSYLLGNRYEVLRRWLAAYAEGPTLPLDHFWARLFEDVLSQPGYIFARHRDSAAAAAHLIESARRFRQTVGDGDELAPAASFISLVEQGVIAAQVLPPADELQAEAVLLAPAYTFVMGSRPVEVQFWLDLSSSNWGRRLYQPLTHPYVLTRRWPVGRPWTDADEDLANREMLYRLAVGLIRRCRRRIYLADSTYNERGFEEHGPLQQVIFRTLRRVARMEAEAGHV